MHSLVEELVAGDTLNENAISNYVHGINPEQLEKIQKQANNLKLSKAAKANALEEIDEMIDNSNRIFTQSNFMHALVSNAIPFTAIVTAVARLTNIEDRKSYREALYDLRHIIKHAKTID